jgi:predicted phosphodiesterase
MRILVVSDLHIDINKTMEFGFINEIDNVDLVVIAGDIAGHYSKELKFLESLKTKTPIIAVAGNHLGYDYYTYNEPHNIEDGTLGFAIRTLQNIDKPVHYLHNEFLEFEDFIIYGGTMYTDFNLQGIQKISMERAKKGLNDFRYVQVYDHIEERVRTVEPRDYVKWFKQFKDGLDDILETTNKDIIVVTHFNPSHKCINKKFLEYSMSRLNPAYASNLTEFILQNSKIKLWISGHTHTPFDFNLEHCRLVCEPYGYYGYDSTCTPKEYFGKVVEI